MNAFFKEKTFLEGSTRQMPVVKTPIVMPFASKSSRELTDGL